MPWSVLHVKFLFCIRKAAKNERLPVKKWKAEHREGTVYLLQKPKKGEEKLAQTVLITGTGRPYALGFNMVKRYLEHGDTVFASVRRPSEALEALQEEYPDRLHILNMDIAVTESVNAAAWAAGKLTDHLDLIINNATTASADTMKELPDFDLDLIAPAVNVGAVGPIRVLKAFLPLLKKSAIGGLVVNICLLF